MNLGTFWWLSEWVIERKCNNIIERYFENKYVVENRDFKPFFVEEFIMYL
jgi:hypothetical protein